VERRGLLADFCHCSGAGIPELVLLELVPERGEVEAEDLCRSGPVSSALLQCMFEETGLQACH